MKRSGTIRATPGPWAGVSVVFKSQTISGLDITGENDRIINDSGDYVNSITTLYEYDSDTGLLKNTTAPNGLKTEYKYDAVNRLTDTLIYLNKDNITPDITKNINFIDEENKSIYTDETGKETTFIYDGLGRLKQIDQLVNIGNQTDVPMTTEYIYDAYGRITEVKTFDYDFNSEGDIENLGSPEILKTIYKYDAFDRVRFVYYPQENGETDEVNSPFVQLLYNDTTNTVTIKNEKDETIAEETSDWAGRLTEAHQFFEPENYYTWKFAYNSKGNKITQTLPRGNGATSNTYDPYGQLLQTLMPYVNIIKPGQSEPENYQPKQSFVYDNLGNQIEAYSANANTLSQELRDRAKTATKYDKLNRPIKTTQNPFDTSDPSKAITTLLTYDLAGNRVIMTDGKENDWKYTYTPQGFLESESDPESDPETNTTYYTYDIKGNKTSATDPRGVTKNTDGSFIIDNDFTTFFIYDDLNRVVKTILPDNDATDNDDQTININNLEYETSLENNPSISVVYDEAGNKIKETDATGVSRIYTYTKRNWLKTESILGKDESIPQLLAKNFYDETGKLKATEDALGNRTEYDYDLLGRLIKTTYPDLTTEQFKYDALGQQTRSLNGNGAMTETRYNPLGWVTETIQHTQKTFTNVNEDITGTVAHSYQYQFDPNGNQVKMTKPNGLEYNFQYDYLNRLTQSLDSLGQATTTTYDKNGNIETKTDVNNNTWTYSYKSNNLLQDIVVTDQNENQIYSSNQSYDSAGNLLSISDDNSSITYNYNPRNSITDEINNIEGIDYTKAYQYNNSGKLQRMSYPGTENTLEYKYTAKGLLEEITGYTEANPMDQYDELLRLKNLNLINGTTNHYEYDQNSRLQEVKASNTNNNLLYQKFTYDGASNIKGIQTKEDNVESTRLYNYDEKNQLTQSTVPENYLEETATIGQTQVFKDDHIAQKPVTLLSQDQITIDDMNRSIVIDLKESENISEIQFGPEISDITAIELIQIAWYTNHETSLILTTENIPLTQLDGENKLTIGRTIDKLSIKLASGYNSTETLQSIADNLKLLDGSEQIAANYSLIKLDSRANSIVMEFPQTADYNGPHNLDKKLSLLLN